MLLWATTTALRWGTQVGASGAAAAAAAAHANVAVLPQLLLWPPAAAQCRACSSGPEGPAATGVESNTAAFTAAAPAPQPELVDKFISAARSSRQHLLGARKEGIIREFQREDGDVGSPEVQIALLTERIRDLSAHFIIHRKDRHSARGMQGLLTQRRKLLSYLRRSAFERYMFVLNRLGLKDTYAKQKRYDNYRTGTRLGAPAEPLERYGRRK